MTTTPLRRRRTPAQQAAADAAYLKALEAVDAAAGDRDAAVALGQIVAAARELRALEWEPYEWQHPHLHPEGWTSERAPGVCDARCYALPPAVIPVHGYWLQRGGRGTGKTEGAAHYLNRHANGPACDPRTPGGHRLTIVAPTQADAVTSCVTGVSGIQAINPAVTITTTREGTLARWPNGALARVVGAHTDKDVDRLRAWTNVCCVWVEEAAAMVHLSDVLDQLPFTLRLGDRPHGVITTTPKNRPEVTALIEGHPDRPTIAPAAVQTWGRTVDAHRLHPAIRGELEAKYAGTTLGRQELGGEKITTVPGALWIMKREADTPVTDDRPALDADRLPAGSVGWTSHNPGGISTPNVVVPDRSSITVHRTVVTLDPNAGGDDEAGLIVLGAIGATAYVLADLSGPMSSDGWARAAVRAYFDYGAEGVAYEKGWGDLVPNTIRSVTLEDGRRGDQVPLFPMPTKVGKRLRAEPVQAVYQQHRVRHVGTFPLLEDQQTTWVPDQTADSPDRVDALVHGVTFLLIRAAAASLASPAAGTGAAGRNGLPPGRTGLSRRIR